LLRFSESTPEYHGAKAVRSSKLPYKVQDFTISSQGDIVIVEKKGKRAAIINEDGIMKINLDLPDVGGLWGVARQGDVLFMTDEATQVIHVTLESNKYIKAIPTGLKEMRGLAVSGSTIWLTCFYKGVYKLSVDSDYNMISTELFAPHSASLSCPISVSLTGDRVVVLSWWSHNVNVYSIAGDSLLPSIGGEGYGNGQLYHPDDVATDSKGRIYVADTYNNRIVLFSDSGKFLRNLVELPEGAPVALYLHTKYLYITTINPSVLHIIELA
jgi:DNA-binding beta-propeller fold protein YncE